MTENSNYIAPLPWRLLCLVLPHKWKNMNGVEQCRRCWLINLRENEE